MARQASRIAFNLLGAALGLRDRFLPPERVLHEAEIRSGMTVIDYGCGTGSFILPVAGLVGETGAVLAVDVNPLAVERVARIAGANGLTNVRALRSDCSIDLPDGSVDVALLYDVLHHLRPPEPVLCELHRVLKAHGRLSLSDHHMNPKAIVHCVTATGQYRLARRDRYTHTFVPVRD
ncbi:MAG: class I SAM-dependent methyltransferase [Armatimonadetes bacterium]|nr:class I SAM-dependent methyltransferase [Armatimonadota bacterium]